MLAQIIYGPTALYERDASHRCGVGECVRPSHIAAETRAANCMRDHCTSMPCKVHALTCLRQPDTMCKLCACERLKNKRLLAASSIVASGAKKSGKKRPRGDRTISLADKKSIQPGYDEDYRYVSVQT